MMRLRMVNTRSEIEFSEPCSTRRMGFLSVQHLGTCAGRGLGILASHVLTRCVTRVVGGFGRRKNSGFDVHAGRHPTRTCP